MVNEKKSSIGGLEWRVKVADGSLETLVPEPAGLIRRAGLGLQSLVTGFVMKVWRFLVKAWELAVDDPRRVIHGSKVGLALTLVSMFYYLRPLYQGFGGNAIWAVMTVVVVFDYTVGQTLSKCVNRALGTSLAASLAVGIHWVASKSGKEFEPVILGASVFLLGMAATFSRFIPTIKARFDYGVMIFILTFSLVAVSGYRVEKLLELALQRVTTIAIGISMCILLSMLVCPVWAGQDLHALITRNMNKLANSLDGSVAEYFTDSENETENEKDCHKKSINGYKCVLNSKASEEALAIFARWEPAHGRFGFRHPWKQYLKIGAMMRNCAYCIEALYGCINSEIHADEFTKKHLSDVCMKLSSHSAKVLTELAMITKTMRRSSILDFSVGEMNIAVGDLQNVLKSLPTQLFNNNSTTTTTTTTTSKPDHDNDHQEAKEPTITATKTVPLLEILPVVSIASLLIEITTRIEGIVDAVDELAGLAGFNPADEKKPKQTQLINNKPADTEHSIENQQEQDITMKTLQMV